MDDGGKHAALNIPKAKRNDEIRRLAVAQRVAMGHLPITKNWSISYSLSLDLYILI